MTKEALTTLVKQHLNITVDSRDLMISDVIDAALEYCNLTELPEVSESFIRKKIKTIIDYEAENGTSTVFDVKSIKEGDTSIIYNVDENTSKETVYGLSTKDKESLRKYRRVRK